MNMELVRRLEKLRDEGGPHYDYEVKAINDAIDALSQAQGGVEAKRWPDAGDKMRFLNAHGYDAERERAAKVFDTEKLYTVRNLSIGSWSSIIYFEEVEGAWNSVMFAIATPSLPSAGVEATERLSMPTDPDWYMRKAALEEGHEVGAGRRSQTISPTLEELAEFERLQFETLPKWAQDEITKLRTLTQPVIDEAMVDAAESAIQAAQPGWRAIEEAPKDGTRILIEVVHVNAQYSKDPVGDGWIAVHEAHWIDHNAGGWTWYGLCGTARRWRPLPAAPLPEGVDK